MLRNLWDKIPSFLKNRYVAIIMVFVVWMAFFDRNDMITQAKMRLDLSELEDAKEYFHGEIAVTESELKELLTDKGKLEKFAREKYLMKKDGETVFVIVEEDEKD